MPNPSPSKIETVILENRADWLAMDGVEGVGQSQLDGKPCIKFFLSKPVDHLPDAVEGFAVDRLLTGPIEKQS